MDKVVLVVHTIHGKSHLWKPSQPQFDAVISMVVDVHLMTVLGTAYLLVPLFLKQNKHVLQRAKNFAPNKN